MTFPVRRRLMIVLVSLVAVIVLGLIALEEVQFKNASSYGACAEVETAAAFNKLLAVKNEQLNEFTYDYGLWNEMVKFADHPDPGWAGYSITPQLSNYSVDGIWVFNRDRRKVYSGYRKLEGSLARLSFPARMFDEIASHRDHFLYYMPIPGGVIQVSAATIRPRWDRSGVLRPSGYFIAVRNLSPAYVNSLASTSTATVEVVTGGQSSRMRRMSATAYKQDLFDWRGRPVGQLEFKQDTSFLSLLRRSHEDSISAFVAAAMVVLACAFLAIMRWVSVPLSSISRSLVSQDTRGLAHLARTGTEFGEIASLVSDFFVQKELLEQEIAERRRVEGDLILARKELERRVQERTLELLETNRSLNEEISSRARIESALRKAEEQYRSIIEHTAEGIFQVTPDGLYLNANPALARIHGYDSANDMMAEARDTGTKIYVDAAQRRKFRETVEQDGVVRGFEAQIRRKDGTLTWISENARVVRDKNGDVICYEGTVEDISERRRSEEEILRLNTHLEARLGRIEALRRIDQAINTNHDINTVLGVVLDEMRQQLHVDAAAVLLLEGEHGRLRYTCVRGVRFAGAARASAGALKGFAIKAVASSRSVFIEDIGDTMAPPGAFDHVGKDFVSYYALPLISKGKTKGVIELYHRSALKPDREWVSFLEALTGQATIAIENMSLFEGLQRTNIELGIAYDATIEGWSRALDLRDKETEGHSQRVTELTVRLAEDLGIIGEDLLHVRRGALLHDIGKMGIPDQILLKPGPLSHEEWAIMRMHPVYAYEMLSPIEFLVPALDIPHCHHEKWDGSGYPRGLAGEEIPLAARIFAVIDVWDALRSDRPYREGWSVERVQEYIVSQAGTHFDPMVVDAFLRVIGEHDNRLRVRMAA